MSPQAGGLTLTGSGLPLCAYALNQGSQTHRRQTTMSSNTTKTDFESLPWSQTKTAINTSVVRLAACLEALRTAQVNAPTTEEARLLGVLYRSVESAYSAAVEVKWDIER